MTPAGLRFAVLGCLAIGFGACSSNPLGGDGGGGGGSADSFVGTWTYAAGSMITPTSCVVLGITIPPISLAGDTFTITKVDDSHIVLVAGTGCSINFTVSGSTASAASGQSCAIMYMGVNVPLTVTSWTLAVSGGTLTSVESGTSSVAGAMCKATGTDTLTGGPTSAGG